VYGSAVPSIGDGEGVGAAVGRGVGAAVGEGVGATVGEGVGAAVGRAVGAAVGEGVGATVGRGVGNGVGSGVGAAVGASVAMHSSQPAHGSKLHFLSAGTLSQNDMHGALTSMVEQMSQPLHGGIPHFSSHSLGIFSQKSLHSPLPSVRSASKATCIAPIELKHSMVTTTCMATVVMEDAEQLSAGFPHSGDDFA
jgi:hypothetical protein